MEEVFKAKKGDINVLMIGGRRAGKSSILASMAECCSKKLAGEQLSIVRDEDSGIGLGIKYKELQNYFTAKFKKNGYFTPECKGDKDPASYGFDVDVDDRDLGYNLRFADIPGEWLYIPERAEDLQKAMNISQVIIIAIDTPHLVEELDPALGYGKQHAEFNRVEGLTNFFKTTFQNCNEHRLVIFVPLKCEKYYYGNKTSPDKMGLPMVNARVKAGYKDLLAFLTRSDVQGLCTTAIMPILTLGGVEFFRFDGDSYTGQYSYVLDPALQKFNPQFCEQPLFLTLLYVIALAKIRNEQHKIITWFNETFRNQAKLDQLIGCENTLKRLVQTDAKLGFEILNDPLKMMH